MLFVIVSGRSGSGKSVALHVLEDLGFYCVDNLPIKLLPQLAELLALQSTSVAVSLDVRNLPATLDLFDNALKLLPSHFKTQVLFLDADHQILIQRYSDTRRRHPLFYRYSSLERAIDEERQLLESLLAQADWVIDTSKTSTHELAALLRTHLLGQHEQQLAVLFESFGFKYGMPLDADYIFDVRFLPNPHWDLKLRALTGLDPAVIAFFEQQTEVRHFIKQTCRYLAQWLPLLEHSNRSYLTVAIGCTGGKHRSVYVAKQLADHFCRSGKNVQVRHKGLERKEPVG